VGHKLEAGQVNPRRFSIDSLVSVIADSFLDWSCPAGTLDRAGQNLLHP